MILTTTFVALSMALQGAGVLPGKWPVITPAPKPDQVLARVDGAAITAGMIQDLLWDVRGREILDELLYYQITSGEAAKLGIILTDKELDDAIAQEIQAIKEQLQPGMTLEDALTQAGQTRNRLYISVKTSVLLTKIAFANFKPDAYLRVSTIIHRPKSTSTADLGEAIKLAQTAYDRLVGGDSWDKVFNDIVGDSEARRTNGYIGWRSLDAFPDEVRKELPTLKKGSYTKPVQTPNGIQIFRIEGIGSKVTNEELKQMKDELMAPLRLQTVQRLRKSVKVERLWPNDSAAKSGGN